MSAFGLVEMTRKRVREPLSKLFTEVCDPCHGHGRVKTVVTVAAELLRRVAREAKARPGTKLVAYAAPEVVRWIEAQGEDLTQAMRRHAAAGVRFEARADIRARAIRRGRRCNERDAAPSIARSAASRRMSASARSAPSAAPMSISRAG